MAFKKATNLFNISYIINHIQEPNSIYIVCIQFSKTEVSIDYFIGIEFQLLNIRPTPAAMNIPIT